MSEIRKSSGSLHTLIINLFMEKLAPADKDLYLPPIKVSKLQKN